MLPSTFRVDEGNKVLQDVGILLHFDHTTHHHNPEDLHLKLHRRENPKSRKK